MNKGYLCCSKDLNPCPHALRVGNFTLTLSILLESVSRYTLPLSRSWHGIIIAFVDLRLLPLADLRVIQLSFRHPSFGGSHGFTRIIANPRHYSFLKWNEFVKYVGTLYASSCFPIEWRYSRNCSACFPASDSGFLPHLSMYFNTLSLKRRNRLYHNPKVFWVLSTSA